METTMQTIKVQTKSRPSTVYCGEGAIARAQEFLRGEDAFIVTDSNVNRLYGQAIRAWFPQAEVCVVPAGERHKNRTTLYKILDSMLKAQLHRTSVVAALGGGVIGDMAGFAASQYMRGTRLVQIPTTLLAQVDSSVGGKTAIDFRGVKNVLGAFYQPDRVCCDPLFLETLPKREIRCGAGEIVKTGVLDKGIWEKIKGSASGWASDGFLRSIVGDCVRFKARVVERDETESNGIRKCLNLGHTTGHALELLYGRRSHGEYVMIGIWFESILAEREGVCERAWAEEIRATIRQVLKRILPDSRERSHTGKRCHVCFHEKAGSRSMTGMLRLRADEGRNPSEFSDRPCTRNCAKKDSCLYQEKCRGKRRIF